MSESFALVLPDEPTPVRLMNTIWADRSRVHDALRDADDLRRWLAAAAGQDPDVPISQSDLEHFRRLRDAVRRLAALLTEDTRPAAASATTDVRHAVGDVNHAVTHAATWPQLGFDGSRLQRTSGGTGSPVLQSLSLIAAESIDLLAGADGQRLRACYAPGCVLYFMKDHPRREWCSTACGNRVRAARHYRRHHA